MINKAYTDGDNNMTMFLNSYIHWSGTPDDTNYIAIVSREGFSDRRPRLNITYSPY